MTSSVKRRGFISQLDAITQRGLGRPAQALEAADVEQLARRTVGLGGIKHDAALEADDVHHGLGQFADGDVFAGADIDQRAVVARLHQVHAGVGQVVDVEEFALGGASAPDGVFGVTAQLGFMRLAQQRGQHVAVGEVVVVVGAVEVGGHRADVLPAVLAVVAFSQLDAGDLGDRVGLVGGLQRAGQQVVFLDGLGAVARVDAARTQEHQALDAGQVRAVDQVALDEQVLIEEVSAVEVVGLDAADLGSGDEDVVRLLLSQEGVHGALVDQVQLGVGAGDEVVVAQRLQAPHDGRTHHAAVAGDVDLGVMVGERHG